MRALRGADLFYRGRSTLAAPPFCHRLLLWPQPELPGQMDHRSVPLLFCTRQLLPKDRLFAQEPNRDCSAYKRMSDPVRALCEVARLPRRSGGGGEEGPPTIWFEIGRVEHARRK